MAIRVASISMLEVLVVILALWNEVILADSNPMVVFSTGFVFSWCNRNQAHADEGDDGKANNPIGHDGCAPEMFVPVKGLCNVLNITQLFTAECQDWTRSDCGYRHTRAAACTCGRLSISELRQRGRTDAASAFRNSHLWWFESLTIADTRPGCVF